MNKEDIEKLLKRLPEMSEVKENETEEEDFYLNMRDPSAQIPLFPRSFLNFISLLLILL